MDKINEILQELFVIDPSLQKHELKLKKIADVMLKAAPQGELDTDFSIYLREKIINEAMNIKKSQTKKESAFKFGYFYFAGAGALIAAAVTLLILPNIGNRNFSYSQMQDLGINSQVTVKDAGINAFGKLNFAKADNQNNVAGLGGAGTPEVARLSSDNAVSSNTGLGASSMIYPPYEVTNYKFVYQGEEFEMPQEVLPVLKNVKKSDLGSKAATVLNKISFGLFDVNKVSNKSLSSINFFENNDRGYVFMMNFDDESFSIYRNWTKWPLQTEYNPLAKDKLIPDNEIIKIGNDFANKYGINLATYGTPVVDQSWVRYQMKESQYVPDALQVIYPLLYNDKIVLDESGNPYGPRINVSLRDKQVEGVWDLRTNDYLASDYELEGSKDKILEVAGKGGPNRWPMAGENVKTVEMGIGTPELHYVKVYQFKDNQNFSLLVPALVFPVINNSQENFYQDKVVVPLVKELLENSEPPFMIMEGRGEVNKQ